MNAKHVFWAMIASVCLLFVGVFFSLNVANKNLSDSSKKLLELKLNNRVLDEQKTLLSQATQDIDKYTNLEGIARSIVPQDKDQAKAVREIVKIAGEAQVKLGSISFPASTLGQAVPKIVTPGVDTPKIVTPPLTQVKAVENIPGVYVMEVSIQQDSSQPVTYDKMINFLSRLEKNRRTAHVVSVTVQPDPQNRSLLTFDLVVNIYIKP